jgi:hypothetical protein
MTGSLKIRMHSVNKSIHSICYFFLQQI